MNKTRKSFETKVNYIVRLISLSLILVLTGGRSIWAQENTNAKYTPKDLFGIHASVAPMGMGVLLSPALGTTTDQFTYPQIGGRVQVGWLLHKKSLMQPEIVASYAYGINQDKATTGQLNSISLLDLGAEVSPWSLYVSKGQKHVVAIRLGTYVSMCSTKFQDKTTHYRWGISRRIALEYLYQMDGGTRLGVNLYNHAGHYFGKRPQMGSPVPMYTEELGLAFDLYL